MSSPTPVVTKPEDVSRPEMTIMVLRSHVREGIAPDTEIRPEIVNSAEISLPEVTEEMFDARTGISRLRYSGNPLTSGPRGV